MGETVLSGLLRAGWQPDQIVATDRRPERQVELTAKYGIQMLENVEAVAEADTVILVVKPQDMRDLLAEIAGVIKPGHAGRLAGRRGGHRLDRVRAGRRRRRGPGDAQHPGPGRRGHGGHLAGLAQRPGSPRPGHRDPVRHRSGGHRARALPGRGHGHLRLGPGVPVLRRRGDDRGRRPPRAAPRHRHRAGGADHARLGQAAARDRRAPDGAARAGHLAGRHHRRRRTPARGPQGPRGVHRRHRGGPRPQPRPGRGRLATADRSTSGRAPADERAAGLLRGADQVRLRPRPPDGPGPGQEHHLAGPPARRAGPADRGAAAGDRPGAAGDGAHRRLHRRRAARRAQRRHFGLGTTDNPIFPGMHEITARGRHGQRRGGPAGLDRRGAAGQQRQRRPAPRDARPHQRLLRLQRHRGGHPLAAGPRLRAGRATSTSTCTTATACRRSSTTTRG